jgi:hypothetical protein
MATASYEKCVDGWLSMGDKHPIKQELTNYWIRPYRDMLEKEVNSIKIAIQAGLISSSYGKNIREELNELDQKIASIPVISGAMTKMRSLWPSWPCQVLSLTPEVEQSLYRDLATIPFYWPE